MTNELRRLLDVSRIPLPLDNKGGNPGDLWGGDGRFIGNIDEPLFAAVIVAAVNALADPHTAPDTPEPTAPPTEGVAPMPVLTISYVAPTRLRVELVAASEMAFEVAVRAGEYDKVISAVCHVAPALMLYDMTMTEAFDDGGRTRVPLMATEPVKDFVKRYRDNLVNISVELPPFAKVRREQ